MARWLPSFVIAAAVLTLVRLPAHADPVTLDYQLVVHATEVHTVDAPGRPGREVGIASFRGIAIFADGRIAHHAYAGGFDFIDGAGEFHGYAEWAFDDGSRLQSRYVGRAEPRPGGGITFAGRHGDLTGTGQYADVKGTGSFEGERIDYLQDGGDTHQRGRLELELPDG